MQDNFTFKCHEGFDHIVMVHKYRDYCGANNTSSNYQLEGEVN